MKKVIFMLSLAIVSLVATSCTTDAYDLPETEELRQNEVSEQVLDDFDYSSIAKDGEEDESSNTEDNTGPVVEGSKKD